MLNQLLPALRMTALVTVLTGLIYPLAITGAAQALFRSKANGSLVSAQGRTVGSSLIGQNFSKPEYFHPRPSAAGNDGYDAMASGGSNLGPTSKKLVDRVKDSAAQFRKENPGVHGPLPSDLVTASASGLDPHISPASADVQAERIAATRRTPVDEIRSLISSHIEPPDFGFLGEPRVNVLSLNLDLDQRFPLRTQ
jgi:K+-transporting ATPase ATPase C chain